MEASEILALIIVGVLAGSAAASLLGARWVRQKSSKSGRWVYFAVVGVLGALVGQLLFNALDIDLPDLLSATITVADIVVAFVGALVVLVVVRFLQ